MTTEEMKHLKSGDIVEFRGGVAYHLHKLVRHEDDVWLGTHNGASVVGLSLGQYPENFFLVGHSDYTI